MLTVALKGIAGRKVRALLQHESQHPDPARHLGEKARRAPTLKRASTLARLTMLRC